MHINKTLYSEIGNLIFNDSFTPKLNIEEFLFEKIHFTERQNLAINIIDSIMTRHGKEKLLEYPVRLAKIEYVMRELQKKVRDHVVHALLSYMFLWSADALVCHILMLR